MSKTAEEWNRTHAVVINGVVYPRGALDILSTITKPGHTNPNRLRNKRARQNRRKGKKP